MTKVQLQTALEREKAKVRDLEQTCSDIRQQYLATKDNLKRCDDECKRLSQRAIDARAEAQAAENRPRSQEDQDMMDKLLDIASALSTALAAR